MDTFIRILQRLAILMTRAGMTHPVCSPTSTHCRMGSGAGRSSGPRREAWGCHTLQKRAQVCVQGELPQKKEHDCEHFEWDMPSAKNPEERTATVPTFQRH